MQFFNQFSFLIFSAVGGVVLALLLWRWQRPPLLLRGALMAAYAVGIVLVALLVRYPVGTVDSAEQVEATLNNGNPSLVMLYSNYCVGCMVALPGVRALQNDLADTPINFILLNIHERPGSSLLERFRFEISPTFLLFDRNGQEVLRSSSLPDAAAVRALVQPG